MSVSFYLNPGHITGQLVTCSCGAGQEQFTSYAMAESYLIMWHMEGFLLPGCEGPDPYCVSEIPRIHAISENGDVEAVNMSNINAIDVLREIDLLENGLSGEINPEDLLSRALVQIATSELSAEITPSTEGNSVYCGREEGYVQHKG